MQSVFVFMIELCLYSIFCSAAWRSTISSQYSRRPAGLVPVGDRQERDQNREPGYWHRSSSPRDRESDECRGRTAK
jgi:hypothetical protein